MHLIVAGCLAGCVAGCGGEKKNDNIITVKKESKVPAKPVRMQEYKQARDVEWLGSVYTCEIHRTPDDSLATVQDEDGRKFTDNSISLSIRRSDGSVFFSKTFTKATFKEYIDEDFRQTGILEGLVFDKADGQTLVFAASVSHPQTDEYIPLIVRISRMGDVSIARDTHLDTNAEDEEEM